MPKTIVFDLDGTLCTQMPSGQYHLAEPRPEQISILNSLHRAGNRIVIFTARGMNTFKGNVPEIEKAYREMTEQWLKKNGVEYDQLLFGKPAASMYVDDKGITPDELVRIVTEPFAISIDLLQGFSTKD